MNKEVTPEVLDEILERIHIDLNFETRTPLELLKVGGQDKPIYHIINSVGDIERRVCGNVTIKAGSSDFEVTVTYAEVAIVGKPRLKFGLLYKL